MEYYRCRCGNVKSYTSGEVKCCLRCNLCGTNLSKHPSDHKVPEPHKFITKYNEDTGEPYKMCNVCMTTKMISKDRNR